MNRKMTVRMEPAVVRLEPAQPRIVHSVGEAAALPTARGELTATVFASDAGDGSPVAGTVHFPEGSGPANQPFRRTFSAELDRRSERWNGDLLWVQAAGYDNAEVPYGIEVA